MKMPYGQVLLFKADGLTINVEAKELVLCKDCKHRYHSVECPCQSYDHFYSWTPADDWFCKNGERKES